MKLPESIARNCETTRVLVVFNENEDEVTVVNSKRLLKLFEGKSEGVALNTDNPAKNIIALNASLDSLLQAAVIERVFLDCSTFTHEGLLMMFRLLEYKREKYAELLVGYVGAKDYSTDEPDPEKKWLSSGIREIRSVIGYPGVISPARSNHLIVVFGFEVERTMALIEHVQFDKVSLGFGPEHESIDSAHHHINVVRHRHLMDVYPHATGFELSLTDMNRAKASIDRQVASFPGANTVIAPMNNKVSTLGAALAAIENSSIQLIYVRPVQYNTKGYSVPREDHYLFRAL